jgi:hypothetical protein
MTPEIARNIISRLARQDFGEFVFKLLQTSYGHNLRHYEGLEESAFVRDFKTGDRSDDFNTGYEGVYVIQDIPLEVFRAPEQIAINTPNLRHILSRIRADYADRAIVTGSFVAGDPVLRGIFFVNNLCGYTKDFYREVLLPKYKDFLSTVIPDQYGTPEVDLGNADVFIECGGNLIMSELFAENG